MYFQALDEIRRRELADERLHEVLDDRERRLFVACQLEARTRRSVGREEGISPQRVGQIVATAARKLQRAATSRSSREGGTL
jgi:DNA-directed RNA polymerase specialized sigma subunit